MHLCLLGRLLFKIKREDKNCPETGLQRHLHYPCLFSAGKTIIEMAERSGRGGDRLHFDIVPTMWVGEIHVELVGVGCFKLYQHLWLFSQ